MRREIACVALLVLVLAGCGQRGDLYFPEAGREAVITVPAQVPTDAPPATDEETDEAAAPPAPGQPDAAAAGDAPGNTGQ